MSYNIYPTTATELTYCGYSIKINNAPVPTNTARVSAMPMNRRWPGHQRSLDQTELINFLSLETDEPLSFEITPQEKFDDVVIRPLSLNIKPTITEDGKILFTLERPAYFTVEPYGRHNALHIFADPSFEYTADKNPDNTIYFGKGEHNVGIINLKSNQTLFIDEGAVVYACVRSIDSENIKIIGRGILDNSKNTEQILFKENAENNFSAVNNAVREHTIQLEYCNNIVIEGITIRDSLVYNIRPIGCNNMNISNVKIIGCWRYNSDGIDMHNCTNVTIDNCFLRTFDDSICVKGFDCYYEGDVEEAVHNAMYRNGKSYDIFKNTVIKNCVIWNDWGVALEIGAETRAEEISDIHFVNCSIIHITGSALGCCNVDYADVHNIVYENTTVEYDDIIPCPYYQLSDNDSYKAENPDYSPSLISVTVEFHPEYSANGNRRGKNHNIRFKNIQLYGRHTPKLLLTGYDQSHQTQDIAIENLYWNNEKINSINDLECTSNEFTTNINLI